MLIYLCWFTLFFNIVDFVSCLFTKPKLLCRDKLYTAIFLIIIVNLWLVSLCQHYGWL